MRVKSIQLSWFRGAADAVALDSDCKSMVVYGANGAGKSCFVDAIEYVLNRGKIGHLTHEYSGKRQERAIPNTHKPKEEKTELVFTFSDDSKLKIQINPDGSAKSLGDDPVAMNTWDYGRTILRQDEVAAFIHNTKGAKYSALLPLLGLHGMEVAAENLRQLAKFVEEQSKLTATKATLNEVEKKRKSVFGTDSDDQIFKTIEDLHSNYCTGETATKDVLSHCTELATEITSRIAQFSADQKQYLILRDAAALDLKSHLDSIRAANAELTKVVEPLINEKIEVLQKTASFMGKLVDEKEIKCPACGRMIPVDVFRTHIKGEQERLTKITGIFDERKSEIGYLSDAVKLLKTNLNKEDVKSWKAECQKGLLADNFICLDKIDAEALRTSCEEKDLKTIEEKLLPLIDASGAISKEAPVEVQQLSTDKGLVETAKSLLVISEQTASVARAEALISFINSLEQAIRDEIRLRSRMVIDDISGDVRDMWAILHPNEPIKDVHLYLPDETDKAIDIGLIFHGIEQDSPRLTLSEGYRNSLGLCIFLAMAKRESHNDHLLVLDDVVVSFDRNHRGMIIDVLEKYFGKRHLLIFTHDREWYTELRQQLDGKNWNFKTLLPYETPNIGIRWSHRTTTFDDARALLKERPDAAGNDARKIMDIELALIAEKLQIRLPFLRGEKNDRRLAHDFLERFVADGKICFQKKAEKKYVGHSDAIEAFEKVDRLLVAWANRASHTFNLVSAEAAKLLDSCETALECFKCSSCGMGVWFADAESGEYVQCKCGEIRWRY
ncbi:MAG: hypothetical protein NTX75_13325 [Proteobacteria bacterium]|nr:hypothetical protein [Pseudomonadota bacterium]